MGGARFDASLMVDVRLLIPESKITRLLECDVDLVMVREGIVAIVVAGSRQK